MRRRILLKIGYWTVLSLSVILFGFCIYGLFHSIKMYSIADTNNSTNYISAIAAWSCGLFASLIQFFIIIIAGNNSLKKTMSSTISEIDDMREFLTKYSFFRVAVSNVNNAQNLGMIYNEHNNAVVFRHNLTYDLNHYLIDVNNEMSSNPLFLTKVFDSTTANFYLNPVNRTSRSFICLTNSFTIDAFHSLLGKIDDFLNKYYKGLFIMQLANEFLRSVIDEYVDSLFAYVLFERDMTIAITGGINDLDHRYVLRFIEGRYNN